MTVINTNVKSLISQNAMVKNNRDISTAMQQLSTGKRINSAKDDAAGLAISSRMTAQVRGLDAAVRNANDGISLLQTAEGALIETTNMLQRMRELSIQSANDTNTADDRRFLDLEFQQLKQEINRIANNTEWNGMSILNRAAEAGNGAGKFEFQVGANASQLISITLKDFTIEPAVIGSPPSVTPLQSSGLVSKSTSVIASTGTAQVPPTNGTPEVQAVSQKSLLKLAGSYVAGDKIKLEVKLASDAQARSYTYTVTSTDVGSGDAIANITSSILSVTGIDNTLGVTLQKDANNNLGLTGPAGVSFTGSITTTPDALSTAGKVSAPVSTTVNGREVDTVTLSGTFVVGDVLTFSNETSSTTYTVQAGDVASVSTLATNIRTRLSGYFPDTLIDATADQLAFTKTTTGVNLTVSSSVAYKRDLDSYSLTTAAVAYKPAIPPTSGSPAIPPTAQVSSLSFSQQFFKDDVISVQVGTQTYSYTVTEDDEKSANSANSVVDGITLKMLENPPAGVSVARNGSQIELTGDSSGNSFVLNVTNNKTTRNISNPEVIARQAGSLNMINTVNILTRTNADTAITNLDSAIFTINEARAEMGAVMNRLSYAGDNLINVSQNTSESRSRILDADYAKASSELARTQIISQAATAMLAQANQSPQSVLQLLRGG